ncbi:hypothetical protein NX059_003594 [Plenodomus lindquistii]|nr:hypothetical protein NX059_003594 [Plenodomus lindquistii]
MTDPAPSQSSANDNPYTTLHAHTSVKAHPDSEEVVQYERRRVSFELEPTRRGSRRSVDTDQVAETAHDAPFQRASQEALRRHISAPSETNGQAQWHNSIVMFWTTHVCPSLEEGAYRDHLALERTFLGYLRTSLILVMTGVLIAQLFHLQHSPTPNGNYGFHVIGRPLSAVFIGMAIVVLLIGAVRFWRIQRLLLGGKTLTGGWEVLAVMGLSVLLLVGTFALVLGVDIDKTYFDG